MTEPQIYPIDDTLQPYYKLNQWYTGGKAAMTIRCKIYIENIGAITSILFKHEMVHVKQQEALGYATFKFLYVLWWIILFFTPGKRPYEDNPFELEADELRRFYQGWNNVTKDSWKRYIKK